MATINTSFEPFSLGQILATQGVIEAVSDNRRLECLLRHLSGDWGNVSMLGAAENNRSTREGFCILSAYAIDPSKPAGDEGENCFWIVTEGHRGYTTILLPMER